MYTDQVAAALLAWCCFFVVRAYATNSARGSGQHSRRVGLPPFLGDALFLRDGAVELRLSLASLSMLSTFGDDRVF